MTSDSFDRTVFLLCPKLACSWEYKLWILTTLICTKFPETFARVVKLSQNIHENNALYSISHLWIPNLSVLSVSVLTEWWYAIIYQNQIIQNSLPSSQKALKWSWISKFKSLLIKSYEFKCTVDCTIELAN